MLLRGLFVFLSFFALFIAGSGFVYAQSEAEKSEGGDFLSDPLKTERAQALNSAVSAKIKSLDYADAQHFFILYKNYTMVSAVKAVEADLKMAVDACSEENPKMKKDLNSRYEAWHDAVAKSMESAMSNINNMILAQTYESRANLESLFREADDVRADTDSRFKKIPVSTPEACEYMVSKMEETRDQMISLLSTTLVTYPTAVQRSQP